MAKTYLFWEPLSDNILQERDEFGALTAEYTTEPGLYGNVISQNRGGVATQFHYDALGSTLAVTGDNQQVTDTMAYSAFGETSERTGTTVFALQYAGQRGYCRRNNTGDYDVRLRVFHAPRGRWLSLDPLAIHIGGIPSYVYVWNMAATSIDPSGAIPIFEDPRPFPPRRPRSPRRPHGRWTCQQRPTPQTPGRRFTFEDTFVRDCKECKESCRIIVTANRCFHESVPGGTDRDPTLFFTVFQVTFERRSRTCGDQKLPDDTTYINGCELYPGRHVFGGGPLQTAVIAYLATLDSCTDFSFEAMCDKVTDVPPPRPGPGVP